MAKNKSIDLQLSEVDLQALESIGVISVQNNMETGSSNSNANFRRAISWIVNRDCAMITAWRKEKKDGTPRRVLKIITTTKRSFRNCVNMDMVYQRCRDAMLR